MIRSFLIAALLALPSVLNAETASSGGTIAVVNNEPIFASELQRESEPFVERFNKTAPEKDRTPEKIAALKKEILDRLIEERLLLQEAKTRKVRVLKTEIERGQEQFKEPFRADEKGAPRKPADIEKAFQDQLIKEGLTQDQFNKRVEEQIMKVKLIEQEVKSKVELPQDAEVRDFFEKIKAKMAGKPVKTLSKEEEADLSQISKYLERMTGEQVNIRHILIRSQRAEPASGRAAAKSKLEGILQKIRGGEDFAFMAKKFTDDPLSKERGGDLGFIARGDLGLPEMDAVIFKLKEGEVSPVVETEIGYHIVKMVEKKNPHPLEYEDVKEDLANYLAQRVFTQKLEKYLKDLRAKASIKVNPID
ncbi:MAG: hypothetical protein A3A86_00095 [Elusimicrobia bacterium RIFCSPLOWO2_01_FULL_60_11]|nr:MAG: hypothetical protein A3A86_00095 [Elusimicrobia bacterium RIFCSPLOWO2_01_FULL_60_11]